MIRSLEAPSKVRHTNRRGAAMVTARRQTSSMSTMSYFQRFSARSIRSRNLGVISLDLSGWKRPALPRAHALEAQDAPAPRPLTQPRPLK